MGMKPRRITLHIEELVLHGVAPAARHIVAEAMQRELEQLLAVQGVPATLTSAAEVERIDAGTLSSATGAGPEGLGASAARAVFRGMGKV